MNNLAEGDGFTTAVGNVQNLLQKKKKLEKLALDGGLCFSSYQSKQEAGVQGRLAQ